MKTYLELRSFFGLPSSHNLLAIKSVEQITTNITDAFVYHSLVFGLHNLSPFYFTFMHFATLSIGDANDKAIALANSCCILCRVDVTKNCK